MTVKLDNETEIDLDEDGYYIIRMGEEDLTITVTNHKDVIIPTGIYTDSLPYLIVLTFVTFALSVIVIRKRIYKANAGRR